MKKVIYMGFFSFLLGLTACHESCHKTQSVNAEKFASIVANKGVQILDVRSVEEYNEGHIANSLNIDVMKDDFTNLATLQLKKDKTVALYCRSGRRSKTAMEILSKKGYDVIELAGGFNEWKESSREIEK